MAAIMGTIINGAATIGLTVAQRNIPSTNKFVAFEPEGLVNLIELGLLAQTQMHAVGTLIGFKDHSIQHYPPHMLQGISRNINDQSHEDLSSLEDYLKLIMRRVWVPTNSAEEKKNIETIARFAIRGISALQTSYEKNYTNDPKQLKLVKNYLNKGIEAIDNALKSELKECPEIELDKEVRKNYEKYSDYRSVASTIESLAKPGNTLDLNNLYVTVLDSWAKLRIAEFHLIKNQVLKKGNLYS